ncbi:PREDICTED: complement C4-A-like [Mandrillus leucophaeus]|uniref:complement C4-A-like n=1 Tax=Mandrillus leucophaeus TaxID=9568 RepID=UPI0005F50652|nr:PREDICTED: complement C4-A-like [Mandrillus leucophaeus]
MRIQQFRKADGSYAAWLSRDSSTWLTAFVLKVLSLAQEQVGGSPEKLQETSKWLLSQQQADGSFQDPCPVIHRNMQGGLVGSDETVALTAFVTIALHHGLAVFQDEGAEELKQRVEASISKANSFLGEKASAGLLGAHAAAITAYALTLTKASGDLRGVAHNNLMAMAQETGDNLYWGSVTSSQSNAVSPTPAPRNPADPMPQAPALWIETTAYALLHLLLHEGKAEMADQTAAWLTRQGSFQGGFRSTQDTVIALDALSAYWIASHTTEERGLNVTLSSTGRSGFRSHALQLNNRQIRGLEEELQFSLGSKINVKVGGNSKGTLKTLLRAWGSEDWRKVTLWEVKSPETLRSSLESSLSRRVTECEGHWREGQQEPNKNRPRKSSIGGCRAQGVGPSSLLPTLGQVPTSRECMGFEAVQEVPVGLVQPASAALYDYYNPERRCSVFYGAPSKSRLLATLCSAEVCQCAEGKCPRQRRALERGLQDEDGYRMKFACYYPRVEYGFQVKVLREDSRAAFRLFETKITQVLHFTKDVKATVNQMRNFLVRASCRLRLEPGREYLIMGLDGATYDLEGHPQYLLDSNSWIEEMPSERLCRSTRQRAACAQLNDFLQEYGTQGCQV